MQAHLFVWILLLICALRSILSMSTSEEELPYLNRLRKSVADNLQIANMYEIVYNKEYERKLLDYTCGSLPEGDFTFVRAPTENDLAELDTLNPKDKRAVLEAFMRMVIGEFINPVQYLIGCAVLPKPCGQVSQACLIGPRRHLSKEYFRMGPAGSKCPDGKLSSNLCRPPGYRSSASQRPSEDQKPRIDASSGRVESKNEMSSGKRIGFYLPLILMMLNFIETRFE